jgi:YD repeat-containing protein
VESVIGLVVMMMNKKKNDDEDDDACRTSAPRAGMSAAYRYGPGGMRESKSVTTEGVTRTTQSVWSGMTLVAERDSEGTRYEYHLRRRRAARARRDAQRRSERALRLPGRCGGLGHRHHG